MTDWDLFWKRYGLLVAFALSLALWAVILWGAWSLVGWLT